MATNRTNTDIIAKFNSVVGKIGDIPVKNIWNVSPDGTNKILNIGLLTQSLVSSILALSRIDIQIGSDDLTKISKFLNTISIATDNFCKFLDYDGNGVIELVDRNDKGEIVLGNDITAMLNDGNQIVSAFKTKGNTQTVIIAVISSMAIYFTNKNVTSTRHDFVNFKLSCDNAYTAMLALKTLNIDAFFKDNIDDFMRFIIVTCILIVPVIELATIRIAAINNPANKDKLIDLAVITKDDITNSINDEYGVNIDLVLGSVETLVNSFTEVINTKVAVVGGFTALMRKVFCCVAPLEPVTQVTPLEPVTPDTTITPLEQVTTVIPDTTITPVEPVTPDTTINPVIVVTPVQ